MCGLFRIPQSNLMPEMTFEEAEKIITPLGIKNQTMLDGLEFMDDLWNRHCFTAADPVDDDEFYDNWIYEVNAFNVVYKRISPLFA